MLQSVLEYQRRSERSPRIKESIQMGRVSGIDSGNETEEGSPDSDLVSVATTPHNFSDRINQDKVVIKPVAFKPTGLPKGTNGPRYGSTPSLARPGSILTLYGSNSDLRQRRNYSLDRKRTCSPMAMSSLPLTSESGHRSLGYESLDSIYTSPTPTSLKENFRIGRPETGLPRVRSVCSEPKESIGSDLETALRERDSELQYLRQTMEHNEQAIIRVYQEKERAWERELRRMKEVSEARLHKASSKALRLEQMLIMQTYQLQQDKKRLREELERSESEGSEARKEAQVLKSRLDETEWRLCQKSGEVSLLKSQLKDLQSEQSSKCQEIVSLKNQMRELRGKLEEKETELQRALGRLGRKQQQIDQLQIDQLNLTLQEINSVSENDYKEEIVKERENRVSEDEEQVDYKKEAEKLKATLSTERGEWASERQRWSEEKDKVLKYQRQLQINYVQMYKRTQYLEEELDRFNSNLDDPDQKLPSISSTSIQL